MALSIKSSLGKSCGEGVAAESSGGTGLLRWRTHYEQASRREDKDESRDTACPKTSRVLVPSNQPACHVSHPPPSSLGVRTKIARIDPPPHIPSPPHLTTRTGRSKCAAVMITCVSQWEEKKHKNKHTEEGY